MKKSRVMEALTAQAEADRAKALMAGAGLDLTVLKPHPEQIVVSVGGTTQNRGPDAQKETEIFAEIKKDITKKGINIPICFPRNIIGLVI